MSLTKYIQKVSGCKRQLPASGTDGAGAAPWQEEEQAHQGWQKMVANHCVSELNTEATRHLRGPKGLTGTQSPPAAPRQGGRSSRGILMHPNCNQMGLNVLEGPWQGMAPSCQQTLCCQKDGHKPRFSCPEPSRSATTGKSRGIKREEVGAALPSLGGNQGTHPYACACFPVRKAEYMGLSWQQQCQALPGALQVKHDAALQHCNVVASSSP